jgi:hypothetical protein
MKNGDGWWNGSQPRKIGRILEKLFGTDAKEEYYCVIIRKKWTTGVGSNFHYWYQWDINVYRAEISPWKLEEFQETKTINEEEIIFGERYDLEIQKTRTGYCVTLID